MLYHDFTILLQKNADRKLKKSLSVWSLLGYLTTLQVHGGKGSVHIERPSLALSNGTAIFDVHAEASGFGLSQDRVFSSLSVVFQVERS